MFDGKISLSVTNFCKSSKNFKTCGLLKALALAADVASGVLNEMEGLRSLNLFSQSQPAICVSSSNLWGSPNFLENSNANFLTSVVVNPKNLCSKSSKCSTNCFSKTDSKVGLKRPRFTGTFTKWRRSVACGTLNVLDAFNHPILFSLTFSMAFAISSFDHE